MMEKFSKEQDTDRVDLARAEVYGAFGVSEPATETPDTVRGIGVVSSEIASAATTYETVKPSPTSVHTGDRLVSPDYLRQMGRLIVDQRTRNSRD